MGAAELAGCIIAAVQGRELVINEAVGEIDDEDEDDVDVSDDDADLGDDDVVHHENAGFQQFSRRPRTQRRRSVLDNHTLGTTSEGVLQLLSSRFRKSLRCSEARQIQHRGTPCSRTRC